MEAEELLSLRLSELLKRAAAAGVPAATAINGSHKGLTSHINKAPQLPRLQRLRVPPWLPIPKASKKTARAE